MRTPWGDLTVADAHVHFFSPGFFSSLAAQTRRSVGDLGRILGWQIPQTAEELADLWYGELDRHHVAKAALIASVPGDEDSVATAVARHPDRFYGYFMLNPLAPDAPERVKRALSGGLHGICLFPAMHRYSMQAPRVLTLLETVSGYPGTVVFVHCGVLTVGVRNKLGLPSRFDMRFSNPIDLHAVALDFPSIPFVVPHFGAGYFREALMLCDLCPNVRLDTSSSNSWIKYQPGKMDLLEVFRRALEVAGPRRLLFGSDSSFFPRGWYAQILESQMSLLRQLLVSVEDAAAILGGNLVRLFSERKAETAH